MRARTRTQIIAGIVVLVFWIGIWLTGGSPHSAWLRFFSLAVLAATAVLAAWDHYLWRSPLAQRMTTVPRNLRGTWKGELKSFWVDPETNKVAPAKSAYLVIRQTSSTVSVTQLTDESDSASSFGRVSVGDGLLTLDYMYLNKPRSSLVKRSPIHHGSTSLKITGNPPIRLRGHYWTDRDTRGELVFSTHVASIADDYDSAVAMFDE